MTARQITVIETVHTEGEPLREITTHWAMDGKKLMYSDPVEPQLTPFQVRRLRELSEPAGGLICTCKACAFLRGYVFA